jgi:hypothetical protein
VRGVGGASANMTIMDGSAYCGWVGGCRRASTIENSQSCTTSFDLREMNQNVIIYEPVCTIDGACPKPDVV